MIANPFHPRSERVGVDAIERHRDRIDVRSPAEYAIDHIPGATSHPVLDDAERARIGTLHAREGAFVAKRAGAAIVARNIARMLETAFADKPRDFAPLVYCWRGGQRSRALVHVMNEIGWRAVQLEGGYRAYRRHVVLALDQAPGRQRYRVICGFTGSGKSSLLAALDREGAQVLDLEGIARHRGSLLGDLPTRRSPRSAASRASSWTRSSGSIRRGPCTSKRRASASAASSFPNRCWPRYARRHACAWRRHARCASRC